MRKVTLLVKMERPKDTAQFGFYMFKLKLTRSIVFFNIILYPTLFFTLTSAISLVWPDFATIYWQVGPQAICNCLLACCFTILTSWTLIHSENFQKFYKYKTLN